jgi:Tfp pilus assembly protein FimT
MAVVGIMGLLAAVAVPALKGLTGSGGRKMALTQVLSALDIARNNAISSGTNAAVIFPDKEFKGGEAYKYRSMAVINWNPTNTNSTTMSGSWITLPQGISFTPSSIANLSTLSNVSVRILATTSNLPTVQGVIFQSDGALEESSYKTTLTTTGISYFEGKVTNDTTIPTLTSTKVETIRITRYTGRPSSTLAPAP